MNKQFLQDRLNKLHQQREEQEELVHKHTANVQAIHGAMQECSHHLAEILKKEHDESIAKAEEAERLARLQKDSVDKLHADE